MICLLSILLILCNCLVVPVLALSPKETYSRLIPCILDNKNVTAIASYFQYPTDAEQHYQELLQKTSKFRNHHMHATGGHRGPWIENLWIEEFMGKPLEYFNGMIPIFIQWVDIHAHIFLGKENRTHYRYLYDIIPSELSKLLRPDVLYLTVSQDDEGIDRLDHSGLFNRRPNILTLSAGGYGHVPIPLVKGTVDYAPLPANNNFQWQVGFFGQHDTSLTRAKILESAKSEIHKTQLTYHQTVSQNWKRLMASTLFNLCPRGYGRSSFRLAEVIQMGRIPVYLFNDVPWIPYGDTNVSVTHIGFSARPGESMVQMFHRLQRMPSSEKDSILERVKIARYYYTLPGVIEQIKLFIQDPLGPEGGLLRCHPVPPTVL